MKQADILKVIGQELGSTQLDEVNKLLRGKTSLTTKYKLQGKNLRHLGYTVAIKMVTDEGVKIFDVNKVTLIKFSDIESFVKAPPKDKSERIAAKTAPKVAPVKKAAKPAARAQDDDDDDEYDDDDLENFDEVDTELMTAYEASKKKKGRPSKSTGDKGSKFIPAKGRK